MNNITVFGRRKKNSSNDDDFSFWGWMRKNKDDLILEELAPSWMRCIFFHREMVWGPIVPFKTNDDNFVQVTQPLSKFADKIYSICPDVERRVLGELKARREAAERIIGTEERKAEMLSALLK